MAFQPTVVASPCHAPIGREPFFSIRLPGDPQEAYAAVCRILAGSRDPEAALAECSRYVDGCGVERIALTTGRTLHYVNTGDTYKATLCHVTGEGFFVSSWGDVAEEDERTHAERSGERRCAYCSDWGTPSKACGSCGRNPTNGERVGGAS